MYTAAWELRFHPVSSSTCLRRRGDLAEKELADIVPTLINSPVWISTPDLILVKSSIFPTKLAEKPQTHRSDVRQNLAERQLKAAGAEMCTFGN